MEPPIDVYASMEMYIDAIDNNDLEEIKRLIDLGYPIKTDIYTGHLGTLLNRLEGIENIDIIKLLYPHLGKYKNEVLRRLAANNFYGIQDINIGKWIVAENEKLPKKDKVDFDKHIKSAISDSFDEKSLQYLTDIELVSGYLDKNGKLTEDYQATRAYFYPDEEYPRYKGTDRPITKISYAPSNCNKGLYLPIVRYRSLYHKQEKESKICGTFYFYEPDSNNFLNLGNVLVAANKIHAILLLERKNNVSIKNSLIKEGVDNLMEYISGWKDPESVIKGITYLLLDEKDLTSISFPNLTNLLYETVDGYIGANLVGNFDYLDSWICKLAGDQGYDTVLLQREPGEYRAVTEIYDVRPRNKSFNNICKDRLKWIIPETKYPAIWFSDYGFVKI